MEVSDLAITAHVPKDIQVLDRLSRQPLQNFFEVLDRGDGLTAVLCSAYLGARRDDSYFKAQPKATGEADSLHISGIWRMRL